MNDKEEAVADFEKHLVSIFKEAGGLNALITAWRVIEHVFGDAVIDVKSKQEAMKNPNLNVLYLGLVNAGIFYSIDEYLNGKLYEKVSCQIEQDETAKAIVKNIRILGGVKRAADVMSNMIILGNIEKQKDYLSQLIESGSPSFEETFQIARFGYDSIVKIYLKRGLGPSPIPIDDPSLN